MGAALPVLQSRQQRRFRDRRTSLDEVLTEDFLRDASRLPCPRELRLYDRYSDVLAISAGEAERIRGGTRKTRVHYVPMSAEVSCQANTYEGPPSSSARPNPFNLQGLLWFARHVLPAFAERRAVLRARCGQVDLWRLAAPIGDRAPWHCRRPRWGLRPAPVRDLPLACGNRRADQDHRRDGSRVGGRRDLGDRPGAPRSSTASTATSWIRRRSSPSSCRDPWHDRARFAVAR